MFQTKVVLKLEKPFYVQ